MVPRQSVDAVRVVRRLFITALVGVLLAALTPSVGAVGCGGIDLEGGCLFTVTGGDTPDPDDGFAVTNADDVPLWDFVQARDLDALGYPISQRWTDGPFTLQAFQKVILQWDPGERRMNFYNTLDALANRYPEVALPFVPVHQVLEMDAGADFRTVTRNHLALLEENPAIKARFLAEPDWLNLYGLPIRYEERAVEGNPQGVQLLRTQRTVFAVWNVPAPGTTIGQVLLQNVPDQVKKLRDVIVPDYVKRPVREIDDIDTEVAAAIDALPWTTDGVSPLERAAIQRLVRIAQHFPDLFWYLVGEMELFASVLSTVTKPLHSPLTATIPDSLDVVFDIASLPWIRDGLTDLEDLTARTLYDSAFGWPVTIAALLQRDWLHDGLSHDEQRVLDEMYRFVLSDSPYANNRQESDYLVARLVAMPFMDTIEGFEGETFYSLRRVYGIGYDTAEYLDSTEGIVSYLVSKGGLTDDHALILIIHGSDQQYEDSITDPHDPRQFDQYLVDPASRGITIERRQISLPVSGPTQLIVLRDVPVSAQTMDVFEEVVRAVEQIMGAPFPTKNIGVQISPRRNSSGGTPFFAIGGGNFPTGEIDRFLQSVFVHELGHQFWNRSADWIDEGAAMFLEVRSGTMTLDELEWRRIHCEVSRLADLHSLWPRWTGCPYSLGASLFVDLYDALGHSEFQRRFSKLYQIVRTLGSQYYRYNIGNVWGSIARYCYDCGCDYCGGEDPSVYHVRLAFVDESDPTTAATANHIIWHWYYGRGQ